VANYALLLYENPVISDAQIDTLTDKFKDPARDDGAGWRRSIAAWGGCLYGESPFNAPGWEMEEFFLQSLYRRIVEVVGGQETWEGLIGEMTLTYSNGDVFVRSMNPVANYTKVIYQRIGQNLFANGSAESSTASTWTAVGTPATLETSTAWFTNGSQSIHIITDAADEGVQIEDQLAIVAGWAYTCNVFARNVSGTWMLAVYRDDDSSIVAQRETNDVGQIALSCSIPDTNEYTGNTYVRLIDTIGAGRAYFDSAVYRKAPYSVTTGWETDNISVDQFGRLEKIIARSAMTSTSAANIASTYVYHNAFPRTKLPDWFEVIREQRRQNVVPESLIVSVYGYGQFLFKRKFLTAGLAGNAKDTMSTIIGLQSILSAGRLENNTQAVQIEDDETISLWDAVEDIAESGDGSGYPWMAGSYPGRVFDYHARPSTVKYDYRNGKLYHREGGLVHPAQARPNFCRIANWPEEPRMVTGVVTQDPDVVWLDEIEFVAPNTLRFRREEEGEFFD
jgi:hypothetical protein